MAAALVAALAALFLPHGAIAQTPLAGHIIRTPIDPGALAADWFTTGTIIPTKQALMVNPGVVFRQGIMWSRRPVPSNDFEAKVKFTVTTPALTSGQEMPSMQGTALWYAYENASNAQYDASIRYLCNQQMLIDETWQDALHESDFNLLGYRSKFKGLGVFFVFTKDGAFVSAIANKGDTEVLDPEAETFDNFPNARKLSDADLGTTMTVTVRVQPNNVKVTIEGKLSYSWDLPGQMQPGGYLGMTSFGGYYHGAWGPDDRSHKVQLWDLDVTNFDSSVKEEAAEKVELPEFMEKEKEDLLHELSSHSDERSESKAIMELTNTITRLQYESKPMNQQLFHAAVKAGEGLGQVEKSFQRLKDALDKKTGHHLGQEFDQIRKDLAGLAKSHSKIAETRTARVTALHQDVQEVHSAVHSPDSVHNHLNKLMASNQKTLHQLNTEHQTMFGVSISAIAFVIVAGLSLYSKFRCWEKKHVL